MSGNQWRYFFGFRATFLVIGVLYVALAASLFLSGIIATMEQFEVPAEVLHSPHYADAMLWVYSHMVVIGVMVFLIGLFAESRRLKLSMARVLLIAQLYYVYLDFRTADWAFGSALYKTPASLIPGFIGVFVLVLLLHVSFNMSLYKQDS